MGKRALISASWETFRGTPFGRYHSGDRYFIAAEAKRLCTFACWGRFTEDDVARILPLYDAVAANADGPFDLVTDVSAIEAVDRAAFDALARYVGTHMRSRGQQIRRHALVRPEGIIGAMSAGFYALVAPQYPWKDFARLAEALEWLERDDSTIAALIEEARDEAPEIRRLRSYLALHLATASVRDAVHTLATSERSLQRKLEAEGTSFRRELARARIEAAATLIVESDEKIEVIARRVGFAGASQLGAVFRRVKGETPAEYRRRSRATTSSR